MTDAPETIFIEDEFGEDHEDQWEYGCWGVQKQRGYQTEYTRADLVTAREAAAYERGLRDAADAVRRQWEPTEDRAPLRVCRDAVAGAILARPNPYKEPQG